MMHTPGEIKRLLQQNPPVCFSELGAIDKEAVKTRPLAGRSIAHAREDRPIPFLPWTLYQDFYRTGERRPFEQPYFERRGLLTWHTLAAWLEPEAPELLDSACDIIWAICEESSWKLPAHRPRGAWDFDLGASTTGSSLATAAHLLADRLPEDVYARIVDEVRKRILDPYLEHGEDYWWHTGGNNWTGVCAGSAGLAYLMLEDNLDRQAKGIAQVLVHLSRFIERGFAQDGGCLEGIGYWN